MIQSAGDGFWATVELLVDGIQEVTRVDVFNDDIEDWLETMANKVKKLRHQTENNHDDLLSEDSDDLKMDFGTLGGYCFSNPPVRSRLEMLMGSNVVRLTDRRYMQRLMARIRQDYESRQHSRIEERKKNELMRTKMMILNRLIPVQEAPIEIRRYPLFQLYLYCDAIIQEKRKKRSPKQMKIAQSLYQMLYPTQKTEEKGEKVEKEVYMKRVYVDGIPELVPMTAEEAAGIQREQEAVNDIDNGYMLPQEEYDRLHYETDAIKDLREAQKVEDMYAKAHEILGILYSYVDDGRYKKPAKPEKITESASDPPQGAPKPEDNDLTPESNN